MGNKQYNKLWRMPCLKISVSLVMELEILSALPARVQANVFFAMAGEHEQTLTIIRNLHAPLAMAVAVVEIADHWVTLRVPSVVEAVISS
jgi:hypothetical protein